MQHSGNTNGATGNKPTLAVSVQRLVRPLHLARPEVLRVHSSDWLEFCIYSQKSTFVMTRGCRLKKVKSASHLGPSRSTVSFFTRMSISRTRTLALFA